MDPSLSLKYLKTFDDCIRAIIRRPGFRVVLEEAVRIHREAAIKEQSERAMDFPRKIDASTQTDPTCRDVAVGTTPEKLTVDLASDICTLPTPSTNASTSVDRCVVDNSTTGPLNPKPVSDDRHGRSDRPVTSSSSSPKPSILKQSTSESAKNTENNHTFRKRKRTRSRSDGLCFNCHERGHLYRDCKRPRRRFCYRCKTMNDTLNGCTACGPQWCFDVQHPDMCYQDELPRW